MLNDYRGRLFDSYSSTHVSFLDSDEDAKLNWFLKYVEINYLPLIVEFNKDSSKILEIGCNRGFLLSSLFLFGFKNLFGIDLSEPDIEKAKKLVPRADFAVGDAFSYLDGNQEKFDVVFLKAVLEHVSKNDVLPFLDKIKASLKDGGLVIIDVPNMDWLFASHERYMDFTHEGGFTKESLRQVMNNVFADVHIKPVDNIIISSLAEGMKMRIARFILNKLFMWADAQGASNSIWARSIIGVGRK